MKVVFRHELPLELLIAALCSFAVFQFLPLDGGNSDPGWSLWVSTWEIWHEPQWLLSEPLEAVAVSAFLICSALLITTPFLIGTLRKSRLARIDLTIFCGLAGTAFWTFIFLDSGPHLPPVGVLFLLGAYALNFLGLALVRPPVANGQQA